MVPVSIGLEELPPNNRGSNFGSPIHPRWLDDLDLCVKRDADDAKTSLKEFDFRFDFEASSDDLEKLIKPATKNKPGPSRGKRGDRDVNLVKKALDKMDDEEGIDRILLEGCEDTKEVTGIKKKVDRTRQVHGTVRRDLNTLMPTQTDCEYARAWYRRLRVIHKLYSRGQYVYNIGRKWAKITQAPNKMQFQEMTTEVLDRSLPPPGITIEDLCLATFTSGVNPAELWFGLGTFYTAFEVAAFFGRLKLNRITELDKENVAFYTAMICVDTAPSLEDSETLKIMRGILEFSKFMHFIYPVVAEGFVTLNRPVAPNFLPETAHMDSFFPYADPEDLQPADNLLRPTR